MDFFDQMRELGARIPKQTEHILTEEGTKNALVLPFIAALGYNIFDPLEVIPEFIADVGVKKAKRLTMPSALEGNWRFFLSVNGGELI